MLREFRIHKGVIRIQQPPDAPVAAHDVLEGFVHRTGIVVLDGGAQLFAVILVTHHFEPSRLTMPHTVMIDSISAPRAVP